MSKKSNLWALAVFVVGFVGFKYYLGCLRSEMRGGPPESVLIVTSDLAAGAVLEAAHLARVEVPRSYLDERRIREGQRAQVVGVALAVGLEAGQSLLWSDLADGEARRHLADVVKPGHRAYALDRDANPLGQLLRVGDRVDVLLQDKKASSLLVERVLVLAVGTQLTNESETSPHGRVSGVTVSVTPAQAQELQMAESRGRLRLILRNPDDRRLHRPAAGSSPSEVGTAVRMFSAKPPEREIEHVQ